MAELTSRVTFFTVLIPFCSSAVGWVWSDDHLFYVFLMGTQVHRPMPSSLSSKGVSTITFGINMVFLVAARTLQTI